MAVAFGCLFLLCVGVYHRLEMFGTITFYFNLVVILAYVAQKAINWRMRRIS
jgi:hypothetical protein